MSAESAKHNASVYWRRFGEIAIELGFIDEKQLHDALRIQRAEDNSPQGARALATILFDEEWMSSEQIDHVLNTVLKSS